MSWLWQSCWDMQGLVIWGKPLTFLLYSWLYNKATGPSTAPTPLSPQGSFSISAGSSISLPCQPTEGMTETWPLAIWLVFLGNKSKSPKHIPHLIFMPCLWWHKNSTLACTNKALHWRHWIWLPWGPALNCHLLFYDLGEIHHFSGPQFFVYETYILTVPA